MRKNFIKKICTVIKFAIPLHSQTNARCHSSVGRAKDWKSLCPRFDSWWHHAKESITKVMLSFFIAVRQTGSTGYSEWIYALTSLPFQRLGRLSDKIVLLSWDIHWQRMPYLLNSGSSNGFYLPMKLLHIQHIGCPRKTKSQIRLENFTGHQ